MLRPSVRWFPLLYAAILSAQPRSVVAEYIEDRSAHVHACNCEWSAEGELGGTEAVLAWRFRSGEFQGASLAGVKLAVAICGERNLAVLSWDRKSQFLVDRSASVPQQQAAEAFVREHFGTLFGRVLGRRPADVDFFMDSERAALKIQDVLQLEMRKAKLPEDVQPTSELMYHPFVPMKDYTLGTTTFVQYRARDLNHRWTRYEDGVTGFFGTFFLGPK